MVFVVGDMRIHDVPSQNASRTPPIFSLAVENVTASGNSGASVRFIALADQNMTVAGQDEEIVYIDDLTADSV